MRTIPCFSASELGFFNGTPLVIQPEPMTNKDAVLEGLRVESNCFTGSDIQRKALDAMIFFLESPHDQDVYAPPYIIGGRS